MVSHPVVVGLMLPVFACRFAKLVTFGCGVALDAVGNHFTGCLVLGHVCAGPGFMGKEEPVMMTGHDDKGIEVVAFIGKVKERVLYDLGLVGVLEVAYG